MYDPKVWRNSIFLHVFASLVSFVLWHTKSRVGINSNERKNADCKHQHTQTQVDTKCSLNNIIRNESGRSLFPGSFFFFLFARQRISFPSVPRRVEHVRENKLLVCVCLCLCGARPSFASATGELHTGVWPRGKKITWSFADHCGVGPTMIIVCKVRQIYTVWMDFEIVTHSVKARIDATSFVEMILSGFLHFYKWMRLGILYNF